MPTKSALFTAYNQGRRMVRAGQLDAGRLNRGLGIAQSKQPIRYNATGLRCSCPDATKRGAICKHRIAAALVEA